MAGFNKLPTKQDSATTTATSVFAGVLPTLQPAFLGTAVFDEAQTGNRVEGFSGDGDYVDLPINSGDNIEYFNAAGASQWTVDETDIDASIEDFVGFFFDDDLIYVVAVDEGTTPNTYYTASINSAGTVVNIGNDQPTSDFTVTTTTSWWLEAVLTVGSSMIQRESVGSGNIFARQRNTLGVEEMEINISTGAIVSDPAVVHASIAPLVWKSASGIYINLTNIDTKQMTGTGGFVSRSFDAVNAELIGLYSSSRKYTQWKNNVVIVNNTAITPDAKPRTFDINTFDDWVAALYATYGYTV